MIEILGNFYIKCNQCGYENLIYPSDNEIYCENCKSNIVFNIIACEYPANAFDFVDYHCNGGIFINKPIVQVNYYKFDDYYIDYAYEEYLRAEHELELKKEYIKNMTPREFEIFVGELFKDMGFIVRITQPTRDGGYDIVATKSKPFPFTLIIECKHYNNNHKVGVNIVRSVYGTQTAMQVNQSIIVTSSEFTKDARIFASSRNNLMQLIDINDLLQLMNPNFN